MYKLNISPDSTGYSVLDGNTNVATQLDGGDPRVRADQLGATGTVTVQWTLGPADYKILRAFYRTGTDFGALPFKVDLVGIDDDQVRTYTARFVPGTFKLASQSGLTYIQTASLWVTPLSAGAGGITGSGTDQDTFNDIILIADLPGPLAGLKRAWVTATIAPATVNSHGISGLPPPDYPIFVVASGGLTTGAMAAGAGFLFEPTASCQWGGYILPATIPIASVRHIYPVAVFTTNGGGAQSITCSASPGDNFGPGGSGVGVDIAAATGGNLVGVTIDASVFVSNPRPENSGTLSVSLVAMAVDYHV